MCGRFALNVTAADLTHVFDVPVPEDWSPRFNVAPSQDVLVLRAAAPEAGRAPVKHWTRMRWGLVPAWAKDPSIGNRMINARAETVAEKPSFRAAFANRRCLVPASGFFEWERAGSVKVPHLISVRDAPVFAMAGIWERWRAPEGSDVESFAIVTTAANTFMARIHDRMPVILPREHWNAWLGEAPKESLTGLLTPPPSEALREHAVSKRVNNPRNDDPACVEPVNP